MSNPTTPFSWQMPTATDLVTDLPADFEVFGQAVATSMADLLGGTTGQILSKATNTDMDFVWVSANPGDITAVNTTAPLQGGATSGAVTLSVDAATTLAAGVVQLTNSTSSTSTTTAAVPANVKTAYDLAAAAIPKSTVTTNGDLIYGTGSGTVSRLGVGSTGNVLTVSGGVPVWSAPAGGGKVLQVVTATYSTATTNSTTTFSDTGLSVSITPSSATSKILIMVSQMGAARSSGSANNAINLKLVRAGTDIATISSAGLATTTALQIIASYSYSYLDSPATTSATTYKTQFANDSASSFVRVQYNSEKSSIIAMEIGA